VSEAAVVPQTTETVPVVTPVVTETKVEATPAPVKTILDTAEVSTTETKVDDVVKTEEVKQEVVYDIKAPEGVALDAAAVDQFVTEVAKATNLTNEQAQAVIEFGAKRQVAMQEAAEKAMVEQVMKEEADGLAELRKDSDLGGSKYDQTLKLAAEAMRKFASPDEIQFLQETRVCNRVPMIKLFHKIALAFKEERVVGSAQQTITPEPQKKSTADILFDGNAVKPRVE
jgi:hypothetical protein